MNDNYDQDYEQGYIPPEQMPKNSRPQAVKPAPPQPRQTLDKSAEKPKKKSNAIVWLASVLSLVIIVSILVMLFVFLGDKKDDSGISEEVTATDATESAATEPAEENIIDDSVPIAEDFIITGKTFQYTGDSLERVSKASYKPGETVSVEFLLIDYGSHKSVSMAAVPAFSSNASGFTVEMTDPYNSAPALNIAPVWKKTADTYYCYTKDRKENPTSFNDYKTIISFDVTIPEDAEAGEYYFYFNRFTIVEKVQEPKIEFTPTVQPALIVVE